MYGFEAVADALSKEGVKDIFAVVADDNVEMLIEAVENKGARVVVARNERGAAAMADGYSRATGRVGVCTVTQGPGLTNTATSLVAARKHRSPVICLTTEPPAIERHYRSRKGMEQRPYADATAGKYLRVRHIETLAEDMQIAFRYARSGPAPVVVAVPQDVMIGNHDLDWEYLPALSGDPERQRVCPDPEVIARAAAILGEAERPAILVGRGAFESNAEDQIKVLAEQTGAVIATTVLCRGYMADHPYNVGVAGLVGADAMNSLLSECDCVVAVGCSLNPDTTEYGMLFAGAQVIHIDRDPGQIGNFLPVAQGVVGDACASTAAINAELAKQGLKRKPGWWNDGVRTSIAASKAIKETAYQDSSEAIDPRRVAAEMDRILPRERIVALDVGHFMFFVAGDISVPGPANFLWATDFGSVGLGLYQGIGAAVGRPDQHVAVFVGDGGFMMSLEELDTAVRHRIPMTVIVMNDDAYGMEVHILEPKGKPVGIALVDNPDFAQVARALGAEGLTVRRPEDMHHVAAQVAKGNRPLLVDVKINRNVVNESLRARMRQARPAAGQPQKLS